MATNRKDDLMPNETRAWALVAIWSLVAMTEAAIPGTDGFVVVTGAVSAACALALAVLRR